MTILAGTAIAMIHTTFISPRFSFRKIPTDLYRAIPALLMPVFVIFLARGGIVTPTEISVFAVVYALTVGAFIYRDLTFSTFLRCVLTTGMMTGVIMLVIMGSSVLQWILSFESVPENLATWMLETLKDPWTIILGMNLLMIVIGTFLDLPRSRASVSPDLHWRHRPQHRAGTGAAWRHDGREPGHRALHATSRHDAIRLSRH